jgi:hypothetical protein
MIRNLKALGLALCAVFMFGAISVSAASAVNDVFTSPIAHTFVTGTQAGTAAQNVLGSKWEPNVPTTCGNTTTYSGTFLGTSIAEVELTPEYRNCTMAGFPATIHDEGCKYVFTGATDPYTTTSNVANGEDATVKLNCSHTGQIRITGPVGCIVTFKDTSGANTVNQNLLGVKYDNELDASINRWVVKMTVTIDRIHYTTNLACQSLGLTATDNDWFLTATVTVRDYEDAAHTKPVNLTVS